MHSCTLLFLLVALSPTWSAARNKDEVDFPYGKSTHELLKGSKAYILQKKLKYEKDPYYSEQWHMNEEVFQYEGKVFQPSMNIAQAHLKNVKGDNVGVVIVGDSRVNFLHSDFDDGRFKWSNTELGLDSRKIKKKEGLGKIENDIPSAVAGIIGMGEWNKYCGVGIAPKCLLGGIVIDPAVIGKRGYPETCISELTRRNPTAIDVFVHVWQPKVKRNKNKISDLIRLKVQNKNPLSQFNEKPARAQVMGSGDNGEFGHTCQCNEYASLDSMFVFGSVGYDGYITDYSESCAAMIAVTFSTTNGDEYYNSVVTIDSNTPTYTKYAPKSTTAVSAAMGAGIIALLTDYFKQRFGNKPPSISDIAFLLAFSSENDYMRNKDSLWFTNGVGLKYSLQAGFGIPSMEKIMRLIDNNWSSMIASEYKFTKSDQSIHFKCSGTQKHNTDMRRSRLVFSYVEPLECQFTITNQYARYIVQSMHVEFTAQLPKRGSMSLYLISPSGTVSCILEGRPHDDSPDGYTKNMNVKTYHFLGEPLVGMWTIRGFYHKGEDDAQPQPQYPQPHNSQPHNSQPHYPQPHYPQPHYPQPHYPQPHYPQPQYPTQPMPPAGQPSAPTWPPQPSVPTWPPQPSAPTWPPQPTAPPMQPPAYSYSQPPPQVPSRRWGYGDERGGTLHECKIKHLGFRVVLVQSLPTALKLKIKQKTAEAVKTDFVLMKQWVDYRYFILAKTNPQRAGLNPLVTLSEVSDHKRYFTRHLIKQQIENVRPIESTSLKDGSESKVSTSWKDESRSKVSKSLRDGSKSNKKKFTRDASSDDGTDNRSSSDESTSSDDSAVKEKRKKKVTRRQNLSNSD